MLKSWNPGKMRIPIGFYSRMQGAFPPKRQFSTQNPQIAAKNVDVCIVGGGPVGMVLSIMLNRFGVSNIILEQSENPWENKSRGSHTYFKQDHPKAHYLSFRTCEILSDLGIREPLEERFNDIETWTNFNYKSHVLGKLDKSDTTDYSLNFGRVNHFKWLQKNNYKRSVPFPELIKHF